jgi:uncharacterized protein (DUF433 family)
MRMIAVERTPDVCGGEARLAGRRIAVWMLVEAKQLGMDDAEIAARYDPPLTPDELASAWAYYDDHESEIDKALWLNRACMIEHENGIPSDLLAQGQGLGFTDEEIREAFEPPLTRERFESIRRG